MKKIIFKQCIIAVGIFLCLTNLNAEITRARTSGTDSSVFAQADKLEAQVSESMQADAWATKETSEAFDSIAAGNPDPKEISQAITAEQKSQNYDPFDYTKEEDSYKDWFVGRRNTMYGETNAYPWTRLGYTYDWGSEDHIGASEFVIKVGSDVMIKSVTKTAEEYIQAQPSNGNTQPNTPTTQNSAIEM